MVRILMDGGFRCIVVLLFLLFSLPFSIVTSHRILKGEAFNCSDCLLREFVHGEISYYNSVSEEFLSK